MKKAGYSLVFLFLMTVFCIPFVLLAEENPAVSNPSGRSNSKVWPETIKIPVASPFSGQLAVYGDSVKKAAQLKEVEVNRAGGINGRPVMVIFEDEKCDPEEAAAVATKLVNNPNVAIVVGHLCSSATLAALPIYLQAKLPAISPYSTNVNIGKMSPFYFRNVYRDDYQGEFLARYVNEVLGYERVVIFYETNDYSMGLMKAFTKEAQRRDIKILGKEPYTSDTTDFIPQLTKIKTMRPDAIFIPGYAPQATLIISQAASVGLKAGFFGADGLDDKLMLKNPDSEGLLVTTPWLSHKAGPLAAEFTASYRRVYGKDPDWFAANTYDAVGMALAAIKEVGMDRVKIRDYLASFDSKTNSYNGVGGKIYFDKNGDCLKSPFVKEIRGGRWVSIRRQFQ